MSNISFIFKFIMDWMNKDDFLKIIYKVFTKVFKKYLNTSMYLVFKYICKKYLVFKYILSMYLVFKYILSMYLVFKYKIVFSAQLCMQKTTIELNGGIQNYIKYDLYLFL